MDLVHNNKLLFICSCGQGFISNKLLFSDMHEEVCGLNFKGLCARMDPINGEELLGYLRKVNFTGMYCIK